MLMYALSVRGWEGEKLKNFKNQREQVIESEGERKEEGKHKRAWDKR